MTGMASEQETGFPHMNSPPHPTPQEKVADEQLGSYSMHISPSRGYTQAPALGRGRLLGDLPLTA